MPLKSKVSKGLGGCVPKCSRGIIGKNNRLSKVDSQPEGNPLVCILHTFKKRQVRSRFEPGPNPPSRRLTKKSGSDTRNSPWVRTCQWFTEPRKLARVQARHTISARALINIHCQFRAYILRFSNIQSSDKVSRNYCQKSPEIQTGTGNGEVTNWLLTCG